MAFDSHLLHHTQPNPGPQKGLGFKFACSLPDDSAFIPLTIRVSLLSLGGSDWQMNHAEERKHAKYENILLSSHRKRMQLTIKESHAFLCQASSYETLHFQNLHLYHSNVSRATSTGGTHSKAPFLHCPWPVTSGGFLLRSAAGTWISTGPVEGKGSVTPPRVLGAAKCRAPPLPAQCHE